MRVQGLRLHRGFEPPAHALEQLEAELDALQSEINQPGFFSLPADKTQPNLDALNAAEAALEQAFARWEELEGLKNQE